MACFCGMPSVYKKQSDFLLDTVFTVDICHDI